MRCIDFYKKWEKDPNWCEKTRTAVAQINSYLDLVSEINTRGIDKDIIYAKFPEGAARPVFKIEDPEIRVKILNYLCACLNRSEKIQAGDLNNLIRSYEGKEKPEINVEQRREVVTNVASEPKLEPKPETEPLPPLSPDAPMEERLKRDEVLLAQAGFRRASDLMAATPIKPPALVIVPVPVTKEQAEYKLTEIVRGYLSPKSKETWEQIRQSGEMGDQNLEIFQGMIDRYGELLGGE
jgi:hypothetical protein